MNPSSSEAPQRSTDMERLLEPYRHVCSLKSKFFRNALIEAFTSGWIHLPSSAIEAVTEIVEMLHNASLMVDDIEDSSALRRGAPAAHRVFGVPVTLNSANLVYFLALQKVLALPALVKDTHPYYTLEQQHRLSDELSQSFASELIALHEGQGMDILWREHLECPSPEQYEQMVQQKTGGLFRLALRMLLTLEVPRENSTVLFDDEEEESHGSASSHAGAPHPQVNHSSSCSTSAAAAAANAASHAQRRPVPTRRETKKYLLIELVNLVAVYFQTLDDLLNVSSATYAQNKSFCEDITEGKFSAPVLHCVRAQRGRGDAALLHILRQRTTDVDLKKHCVQMMVNEGSLAHCEGRLAELRTLISAHVEKVNGLLGDHSEKFAKCMEYLSSLT